MFIFLYTHIHTHIYVYMSLYYFMNKFKGMDENTRWQYWMGREEILGAMGTGVKKKIRIRAIHVLA